MLTKQDAMVNPIELTVFCSRVAAVCDEMGATLKQAAFSPNIRDRLDYSCAVFDVNGELCAQAAHIPVHLGSMAYAMRDIVANHNWLPDSMMVLNDPYLGGTHLPDITLIAPVFVDGELLGFVANRAHHADIGASTPGSMPVSASLEEEGLVISPTWLVLNGKVNPVVMGQILQVMSVPEQTEGDFLAQISANTVGNTRLCALITQYTVPVYRQNLVAMNDYGLRLAQNSLALIPLGEYRFQDQLDDDGQGNFSLLINATLKVTRNEQNLTQVSVDFAGTAPQTAGNVNCPLSVTAAGVLYVFRCLMPAQTPACAGTFSAIKVTAPSGSLLNANYPAAVAAGNVETSTRVVDVVQGALVKAIPEKIPAASHGSMNNLAMGSHQAGCAWNYYETMGGGMGASKVADGLHAVQTHMTNTLNTPVEVLESNFPLQVCRYQIRANSGGHGDHIGGNGLIREYRFLSSTSVTLLTERRQSAPWGIKAGIVSDKLQAQCGVNLLNGNEVPAKVNLDVVCGDVLTVKTPGGGGNSD